MTVTKGHPVPGCLLTASSLLFFSPSSTRFHRGDVLVTTATGVMTEEEGERWGLVPTHAYAVLDIREYKVSRRHLVVTLATCATVFSSRDLLRTSPDLPCVCVCVLQGMRFLQLKNPWSHLRWRGRYSERDDKNWTPDLLKFLNFDPKMAQKIDNGNWSSDWALWERSTATGDRTVLLLPQVCSGWPGRTCVNTMMSST